MEGVGVRLGRSSSRYGTTTVFNGPVRKWKKDWVPIPPSSSNNSNHHHHHNNSNTHHHSSSNGNVNGSNGNSASHLRLYKWTPLNKATSSNDNNNSCSDTKVSSSNTGDDSNGVKDSGNDGIASEEPRKKKFKYFPIALLEEQKKETEENADEDEDKPIGSLENTEEQASKSDGNDEKPDINDVPMEENEADEENQAAPARQDLNELDLSLG